MTPGQSKNPLSDALRASTVDPQEFAFVYDELSDRVLKFLVSRTFDPHVAADLTAETFAKGFAKRRQYRGDCDAEARSWLFVIASHLCREYERRGKVSFKAIAKLNLEVPPLSDDACSEIMRDAELKSLRDAISSALLKIPKDQREAVDLRIVQQLSYSEIAARTQTSEQTARSRVSRGLANFRKHIPDLDPRTS